MKNQFVGLHLDFVGFSTSLLCAIHCAALPFLLSMSPLAGLQLLDNAWIEYVIIIVSFSIASYALAHGYRKHHQKIQALIIVAVGFILIATGHLLSTSEWQEVLFTSCGATVIAIAHIINWKDIKKSKVEFPQCLDPNKHAEKNV